MNKHATDSVRKTMPRVEWLASDHPEMPFFEDTHREVTVRLMSWARDTESSIETSLAKPPDDAVRDLVRMLGEAGWFSLALEGPVDIRTLCLIREALAYRHDLLDYAFSIQVLAAMPLALWGSDKQRAEILPGLCSGTLVGAFALTERESGSDISAVELKATETEAGFLLQGQKHWIANANIADHVVVLARTGGLPGALGLSLFVADCNTDGFSTEPVDLIAPRPFGHIVFDDCLVSSDRIIGDKGMGLAVAIDTLERCRITVGAAANGFSRRALHEASSHVQQRRKTGNRLCDISAVRRILADMTMAAHASRLTVCHAAWEMDRGGSAKSALSSLAKLHATESAQTVVDQCVQLHGAAGLVAGSTPENLYRQIRSLRIYEGASEVQEAILGDAVASGGLR